MRTVVTVIAPVYFPDIRAQGTAPSADSSTAWRCLMPEGTRTYFYFSGQEIGHFVNGEALVYTIFFHAYSGLVRSNMDILARNRLAPSIFRSPIGTKETRISLALTDDSLSILHRNKPIIVLLRHRLHALRRRLGQFLDEPPYRSHSCQLLGHVHQIENKPGEPRKTAKAGTTVFGGSIVLSSIFAQSLIIQNFPCKVPNTSVDHVSM